MPRCQPHGARIFRKLRYRAVADKPLAIHRQVRVARKSDFRRKRSVRPLRLHSSCAGNAEFALHTIRQRGDAQQALRPDNHLLSMMQSRPLREPKTPPHNKPTTSTNARRRVRRRQSRQRQHMHATSSPAHNAAHTTTERERANSIAATQPAQTPNANASTGGIAGREGNETSSSTARPSGTNESRSNSLCAALTRRKSNPPTMRTSCLRSRIPA